MTKQDPLLRMKPVDIAIGRADHRRVKELI